jgi:hypothetical protein
MREDASGSLATEARAVSSSSASSAAAPIARSLRCSGVLPAIGFGASAECSTHLLESDRLRAYVSSQFNVPGIFNSNKQSAWYERTRHVSKHDYQPRYACQS